MKRPSCGDTAFSRIAGHQARHESGIVEAEKPSSWRLSRGSETCRPLASAKRRGLSVEQIPALVVRGCSGQHADFRLEKLDAAHVRERLRPLIDADAILCSESAGVSVG